MPSRVGATCRSPIFMERPLVIGLARYRRKCAPGLLRCGELRLRDPLGRRSAFEAHFVVALALHVLAAPQHLAGPLAARDLVAELELPGLLERIAGCRF